MKPKEEAKELVDKYKYRIVRGVEIEQMSISLAKQCALICVDLGGRRILNKKNSSTFDEIKYY